MKSKNIIISKLGAFAVILCAFGCKDAPEILDSKIEESGTQDDPALTVIDFDHDVRPILNKNCTTCHGGVNVGSESKMPGKLSLIYDIQGVKGDSGRLAVVPGKPEESELYKRIITDDPELLMPMPSHGPRLKQEEVEIIKRWIEEGAEWQVHWAYKPVENVVAPDEELKNKEWVRGDIDRFILAGMEAKGLEPAAPAKPAELLRRVSFDLVGLPPSIEDLDRFEKAYEQDPDKAYTAEVDRLLSSEAYGERWASVWMDLARYADSEGLGIDRKRDVYPYKDWLIEAYNEDMPFDEFTIKQLAGDQLTDPSYKDLIASVFNRLTAANGEGGTNDEEFRVLAVMDRVNTTWEVWQGQTFGCVQCHSHPYDTIEHKEYYKFMAFYNNDSDSDVSTHYPILKVPKDRSKMDDALAKKKAMEASESDYLNTARKVAEKSQWLATSNASLSSKASKSELKIVDGVEEIQVLGNKVNNTTFELSWKPDVTKIEALKITVLPVDIEKAMSQSEDGTVMSSVTLKVTKQDGSVEDVAIKHIIPDSTESNLYYRDSLNPKSSSGWGPFSKMFHPRWAVLVPEKAVSMKGVKSVSLSMNYRMQYLASMVLVPKRSRVEFTSSDDWSSWRETGLSQLQKFGKARNAYKKIPGPSIPIMKSRDQALSRNTHVFDRGNWLQKGEMIKQADTPQAFPKMDIEGESPRRLDMAKWIVNEENPLTARVAVNRFWQQLFGRGIVETLEDFGSSGAKPSHPELLDKLALKFYSDYQWSQKKMLREIVMSATYRQTSEVSREHRAKDPGNRLLSYSPRRRLESEAIRDMGLTASGLITEQLYGHPVYPPLPAGVWKPFDSSDKWVTPEKGQRQRYRRALYTYWKRSIPYPDLMSFDTPTREMCSKRRLVSNTPTAALTTLNGVAYSEYFEGLARRMKYEKEGTLEEKLAYGYKLTTSRRPSPATLEQLVLAFQEAEENYRKNPKQLIGMAGTADGGAYTVVASLLLNLDASLTK